MSARLVNVILVEDNDTQIYYKLEGVKIGVPMTNVIDNSIKN